MQPNTRELVWATLQGGRRRIRSSVAFSLGFKLLQAMLVAPILATGLRLLFVRWGRASIGNFEIVSFLPSPPGLTALVSAGRRRAPEYSVAAPRQAIWDGADWYEARSTSN